MSPSQPTVPVGRAPAKRAPRGSSHVVLWARGALALLGGYALAGSWAAALARLLPGSRADTALVATMAAFVVWTLAAVYAFAARTPLRALLGLSAACALGLLLAWLLRGASA